jgi:hypothetical protein
MRQLQAIGSECESRLRGRVEELEIQLQDLRFQSNESNLRQQEHYEAQKRALQVDQHSQSELGSRGMRPGLDSPVA